MNDVEIESLLEEAGYRFNSLSGRFEELIGTDGAEAAGDYSAEDIADQLEIPLEDLERWQVEQQQEQG